MPLLTIGAASPECGIGGPAPAVADRRVASRLMATVHERFPVPPEALWQALPNGVDAVKGQVPYYDAAAGYVTFSTKLGFFSYGQTVTVKVERTTEGSGLAIQTSLKFGFVDWGEGKRIARKFIAAVGAAVGHTPAA